MKSWTASLALAVTAALSGPRTANALRLSGKYTSNPELTAKIMEHAQYYYPPHADGSDINIDGRELNDVDASSFEITAAHTILFRSCETLTVQADFGNDDDDNGISQTLKTMYAAGQVKAEKSYILFDVCLSEYCDSGKASDHTTFITDMASFINAFLQFIPNKTQAYCQGCFDNQAYCAAESQKVYTSSGSGSSSSSSSSNGGRRLSQNNAELVEYIDCNQCSTYGCYSGAYANVDYSLQWIQSKTQCTRSNNPVYYNGLEITTGFMCNQAGDGVEIAAFVDQDCTLYTNQVAYGNLLTGSEYKYWYNSKTHIEFMFNVGYSCYDPTITYINPTDEAAGTYGDNYQASTGEYYSPQTAEYCSNVFQGSNMDIVQVGTCSASDSSSSGNTEEVAEEDFQQVYTLAEGDVYNGNAVCAALTGMGGSGEHLYDKSASGAMYKYTGGAKTSAAWEKEYNRKNRSRKGAWIAFVVLAVLSVGTGVAYYFYRQKDHTEEDYEQQQQAADKKEPLVDINEPDAPVDENASAYA